MKDTLKKNYRELTDIKEKQQRCLCTECCQMQKAKKVRRKEFCRCSELEEKPMEVQYSNVEVELLRDGGEIKVWAISSFLGVGNWRRTIIFISKIKIYRLFLPQCTRCLNILGHGICS